jgi:secreted trypsin-like serine protease
VLLALVAGLLWLGGGPGAPAARAIVGGQPVPAGRLGYVAHVVIGGQFTCTGVLIAPDWVLTAGHCASVSGSLSQGLDPSPAAWPPAAFSVSVGTVYASGAGGEHRAVSRVIVDPRYQLTNGVGNDAALLRLKAPVGVTPMRIPPAGEARFWRAGAMALIAGFGTTSESSSTYPPQMRYAHVPITSAAYCASKYPFGPDVVQNDGWYDPGTTFCAGYPQGGTDTCEGDSGGPLMTAGPRARLLLVGITSFGDGCAQAGHPGVYDYVAQGPIRSFIASVVPSALSPPARARRPRSGRRRATRPGGRQRRARRPRSGHRRSRRPRSRHRRRR